MECALCREREGTSPITVYSAKRTSQTIVSNREADRLVSTIQSKYHDFRPHVYHVCEACLRKRGRGDWPPRLNRNLLISALAFAATAGGAVWALARALADGRPVWLLLTALLALPAAFAVYAYRESRAIAELKRRAIYDRRRAGEPFPSLLTSLSESECASFLKRHEAVRKRPSQP